METPRRIRVEFDDLKMLKKSHKYAGLRRSWVLLQPGTTTFSDVAARVIEKFKLKRSCPDGVILTMDDFVLPPFESICLLKDTDIIRIKQKNVLRNDEREIGSDQRYIQDSEVVEKQHVIAIRHFEEDSGQPKRKNDTYLLTYNDSAIDNPSKSKKRRKHSDEVQGSKIKKRKTSSKKLNLAVDHDGGPRGKDTDIKLGKSLGTSHRGGSSHVAPDLEDNADHLNSSSEREKREKLKSSSKKLKNATVSAEDIREKDDGIHLGKSLGSSHKKSNSHVASHLEDSAQNVNCSMQREERNNQFEENVGRSKPDKESVQWNGTTNNTKEQKWGKAKTPSKWNDANGNKEHYTGNGFIEQFSGKGISDKDRAGSNSTHFEGLLPLARLPQVGDVLAYRLIEIVESWRPQHSCFRVGQVKSFNNVSMTIVLVPLPEYPIFPNKDAEGNGVNVSPYKEDGTLEIYYPSLVDVRLLKAIDSVATNSNNTGRGTITQDISSVNKWELALANSSNHIEKAVPQPSENQSADWSAWGQMKSSVNEKAAEPQQNNGWDEWAPNRSNTRASWSHSASRGRAPTSIHSRGRNGRGGYRKKGW